MDCNRYRCAYLQTVQYNRIVKIPHNCTPIMVASEEKYSNFINRMLNINTRCIGNQNILCNVIESLTGNHQKFRKEFIIRSILNFIRANFFRCLIFLGLI